MNLIDPNTVPPDVDGPDVTSAVGADTSAAERVEHALEALSAASVALTNDLSDANDDNAISQSGALTLSIVIPVYNEASTIDTILAKVQQLDLPKEVIVVDDGSEDGTADKLEKWRDEANFRVIIKSHNAGKGAALRTGFEYVSGNLVVVQDADLEYDPGQIPSLMQPIISGDADVVYGSRFLEERWSGSSAIHRFGNRLLTRLSNALTGLRLTDMETCYKLFRADMLQQFTIRQDRFGFEPEITAKLARRGQRFVEVPVAYEARDWDAGKKIGVRDGLNALFCILRYALAD